MILTNCAACAAPLAHDAPRCVRCWTRSLGNLNRFNEAKSSLRKTMPVVRRILGESHQQTLKMRKIYAKALYNDDGSTLDDLREAVTTFEDLERTTRRMLGSEHPFVGGIEVNLRNARAALRAREAPPSAGDA